MNLHLFVLRIFQEQGEVYDAIFFEVDLLEKEDDEGGISMKAFSYVNYRWVFVPRTSDIFEKYVSHVDISR